MSYQLNPKASSLLGVNQPKTTVWYDGTFLWVGNHRYGIGDKTVMKVTFDGSTFTVVGGDEDTGDRKTIYGDGSYIYAGATTYLYAYSVSTGVKITSVSVGSTVNTIYCDSQGYIYVGCANGSIYAYTFNGSSFTLRGSVGAFSTDCRKIIGDGSKIHAAGNTTLALKAYSFDGTTFTAAGTRSAHSQIPYGLANMGSGKIAAVYWGRYIDILTYDGSSYTQDHSTYFSDGSNYFWDCVTDGRYLYICKEDEYVGAFLPGVSSTTKESIITDINIPDVGNHIMAIGNGYVFYISGNYIKAVRLDLTATFTIDKTRAAVGESIQFALT